MIRGGLTYTGATLCLLVSLVVAAAQPVILPMEAGDYQHIQFSKIKANKYSFRDHQIRIDVDNSASFLMLPFNSVNHIKNVSFKWRSDGEVNTRDAIHEKQRNGDDVMFKLGLLLKAKFVLPNPFSPEWLKRVEKLLKFPSENMINIVVGAKHAAGEQWVSPYNKRVIMISVSSVKRDDGWWQTSHQFDQAIDVVALWLMADGDDTNSRFTTHIKDVVIE